MAQSDMEDQSTNAFRRQYFDYRGTLSKDTIGMFIGRDDKEGLKGHYFYHRDLKDKQLVGEILSSTDIVLYEIDSSSNRIATFKLQADKEHSTIGTLIGTYIKNGQIDSVDVFVCGSNNQGEPRYRYLSPIENIEENIQGFYYALLANDKQTVAKYINYPLHIYTSPGKGFVAKNKKQFIKKYNVIFTAKMIDQIRYFVPHDLFVNSDGIELGGVWFNKLGLVFSVVH